MHNHEKSDIKKGAAFLGVIVLFAACDTVTYDQELSEESNSGEEITSSWIENNAGSSALANELNKVRKATQVYKDASVANDSEYVPVNYVPEMGFHFVNEDLFAEDENAEAERVDEETVDLTEPPILVYYTTGNFDPSDVIDEDGNVTDDGDEWFENLRLGAVEYAHGGTEGVAADYFSDEEAPRNVRFPEKDGWEVIPGTDNPVLTALHVWVHRNNPKGVFHPTNPTVR